MNGSAPRKRCSGPPHRKDAARAGGVFAPRKSAEWPNLAEIARSEERGAGYEIVMPLWNPVRNSQDESGGEPSAEESSRGDSASRPDSSSAAPESASR